MTLLPASNRVHYCSKTQLSLCVLCIILLFTFLSCSSAIYRKANPALADGKYDSEFPYRNSSEELEKISNSIRSLNCIAYYKTYVFSSRDRITTKNFTEESAGRYADTLQYGESTASGTATIIYSSGQRVAFLTCAHVIDFQDTLFNYYTEPNGSTGPYLQSVSIKIKQENYIPDIPAGEQIEILDMDRTLDIAVLKGQIKSGEPQLMPLFSFPAGRAKELQWGTFVYMFGYPMGYKVLTRALVSSPNRDKSGSFILDAVFNRGFSGGVVLAIRDGVPNFELVGLVRSVPVEYDYLIKPSDDIITTNSSKLMPYSGPLFVERQVNIRYGITRAIPIDLIRDFFVKHREKHRALGYSFDIFYGQNENEDEK